MEQASYDTLNNTKPNESYKTSSIASKLTNLSINNTALPSDCETTTNELLQYYGSAIQEHVNYENDLINNIKVYSTRFANMKLENNLLLNKLNETLRVQQAFK